MTQCHVPKCDKPLHTTLDSGTQLCKGHNSNRQEAFDKIRANKKLPPFEKEMLVIAKRFNQLLKEFIGDQNDLTGELEAIAQTLHNMDERLQHIESHICPQSHPGGPGGFHPENGDPN